jgi:pyrimidine operon attenuation protein/uracil phosphoribosyltransferase
MQLPSAEALFEELARQIRPDVTADTALVGIYTGGVWLAERLHADLGLRQELGTMDVSFYRDDYGRIGLHPKVKPSTIPFDVEGRSVIIVDDVLYTGRTIRAALNELFDYGRPARVDLAVLVDRGGRELPICPRYCAYSLSDPLAPSLSLQLDRDANGIMSLRLVDA